MSSGTNNVRLQILHANFSVPSGVDTGGCSLKSLSELGGHFTSPGEVARDFV